MILEESFDFQLITCFFSCTSEFRPRFQRSLFLRKTTLLTWLKSTLLLKNKCFFTHIYKKTQCLQTNKTQHYCGKKNSWGAWWVRKEVALIKSLIYVREKKTRLRRVWIRSTKVGQIYQLTKASLHNSNFSSKSKPNQFFDTVKINARRYAVHCKD